MPSDELSSLRINRDDPPPARGGRGRAVLIGLIVILLMAAALAWAFAPRGIDVTVDAAVSSGGGAAAASGISANGYVVARTKASVSAKIPGRLEYLGVTEGSDVRKGEVIARLESADAVAALNAARAVVKQNEAHLAQAERELLRARTLRDQNVISTGELENRVTDVEVLAAQLNAARAQARLAEVSLENTRVRAPFDGTVLRKDAEVGEMVSPSSAGGGLTRTAIATMADLATLEVEVDVNEAYIAQIKGDQNARITLDAYPDTSFSGSVRQVVPTADRQKATVMVKVSILDTDPRILPEMGAKVVFVDSNGGATATRPPRSVRIPAAAVSEGQEGPLVWVVEDGRARARGIMVGPARGEMIEVNSGLSGGEQVILQPPPGLSDGARVRPLNR